MSYATSLGYNVHQLSLIDLDSSYRTSGYLIKEEKTILIETGASPSNRAIHSALQELDLDPDCIDFIAVTHIHLDHAGGAGLLMQQCPRATLLVHKRGAAHMADPTKLVAGARQVYGSKFDVMFDPIVPVPEQRIQVMEDHDVLNLGNDRTLTFHDAPGHAFHHFVIHDTASRGIFAGDNAGIFFKKLFDEQGISFCLPVTAPTQFVPDIMDRTLAKLIELEPERIFYTHFGMADSAIDLLNQARVLTAFFGHDCVKHYREEHSQESLFTFIKTRLLAMLKAKGVKGDFPEKAALDQDILLNIQGIVAYVQKLEKNREN